MASNETPTPNIFPYRGIQLLGEYNKLYENGPERSPSRMAKGVQKRSDGDLPVCIIGAGAAGLYTAMIFESLGIKFQIVEANTKERFGGRPLTYHFPAGGPYHYFDRAMGFRDIPLAKRTFDLFRNRGLNLKLIPYIREMVDPPHTPLHFNNNRLHNWASPDPEKPDPFKINGFKSLDDDNLARQHVAEMKVAEVIQPFRDLFRPMNDGTLPDINKALEALFEATNSWSVRTYMLSVLKMDPNDVNWCEALDGSTGTYDLSLTQYVIESMAVNWPSTPHPGPEQPVDDNKGRYLPEHASVDTSALCSGGFGALPRAMFSSLSPGAQADALFESPVTAISHKTQKGRDGNDVEIMEVSIRGEETPRQYSAVISTVPLPRLAVMDLSESGIDENYAQCSAIHSHNYETGLKIGLRFTEAWWEEISNPIHRGQNYTDTALGTIVYPSHPENATRETRSKVLIVSYVRLQDAERLASLINPDGTAKPGLVDLIFCDLARVHNLKVDDIKKHYEGRKEDFFAWDWTQDRSATGVAPLAPEACGKNQTHGTLNQPAAGGKLFIAGGPASTTHAWVVGSLDSAWRAVSQYLSLHHHKGTQEAFSKSWGENEYLIKESTVPGPCKGSAAARKDAEDQFADAYRQLMNRNVDIALQADGIKF